MPKVSKRLGATPQVHAFRVAEIHDQIVEGLQERNPDGKARHGCRIFLDQIRALEERLGRAQGHLDGLAGSFQDGDDIVPSQQSTALFKTQKRLASKVSTLSTKFRRVCMKGS